MYNLPHSNPEAHCIEKNDEAAKETVTVDLWKTLGKSIENTKIF